MTTKEYKALGYKTLSPARLAQLRNSPVAQGKIKRHFGENHWNYKGGHVTGAGYRIICVNGKGGIYEHRHVMEQVLGRPLRKDEVVHHKDSNRSNNDPENLEVMDRRKHDSLTSNAMWRNHSTPEAKEAALFLLSHGWSVAKVGRALRFEWRTVNAWKQCAE